MENKANTELLKLSRKDLKLNQESIAMKLGISRSAYSNIEGGKQNPSIPVLINILKLFSLTFEELYGLKLSKRLIKVKSDRIKEFKKRN